MRPRPQFRLLPIDKLRGHEKIEEAAVRALVRTLRADGVFSEPIWVARGSFTVLNGHHRLEALRRLGARRIPAWVVDYDSDLVTLEPWAPGIVVDKSEVVRRARSGELYPPKTTRHRITKALPSRPVPLAELLAPDRAPAAYRVGRARSRRGIKEDVDSG